MIYLVVSLVIAEDDRNEVDVHNSLFVLSQCIHRSPTLLPFRRVYTQKQPWTRRRAVGLAHYMILSVSKSIIDFTA